MDKIFARAGVTRMNGQLKLRFSNQIDGRMDILIKEGHTDIDIVELREPMTKAAAVAYLLSIDFANGNAEVQAVLEREARKRGVEGYVEAPRKRGRKPRAEAEAVEADAVADDTDNVIELPEAEVEVEAVVAAA